MTNEQLIQKWNNSKDPTSIDLSDVYTGMFIEPDETVDSLFNQFELTVEQVCQSDDDDVQSSLIHIDELMLITSDLIKEFVIKTVFNEADLETLKMEYEVLIKDVEQIYKYIAGEFMCIKNKLGQSS
jgi:dGTP triphosphohydrolase